MPPDPLLEQLERTLADSYKREIEAEENVWRSLPFFAATLALQFAGLAQARDWLLAMQGNAALVAIVLLVLAGGSTALGLLFLAQSIAPAEFRYLSRETELLRYAGALREQERSAGREVAEASAAALASFRATLVAQYAMAVDHNRAINRRRATRRTRAALAILCSVLLVTALVALTLGTNMSHATGAGPIHDSQKPAESTRATESGAIRPGLPGEDPAAARPGGKAGRTADGGGARGMVEPQGGGAAARGAASGG